MLGLNERQDRFCVAVAEGMPPYQAYKAAGYSGQANGAYQLIKKPLVIARIEQIRQFRDRTVGEVLTNAVSREAITKQWIMDRLQQNAISCMEREPRWAYNPAAANRALELLGKEMSMFLDRKEIGRPGDFAGLSDEELEARLMRTLIDRGLSEEQARILVARQRVRGGMLDPAKRLEAPAVTDIEEAVEDEAASARIGSGDEPGKG